MVPSWMSSWNRVEGRLADDRILHVIPAYQGNSRFSGQERSFTNNVGDAPEAGGDFPLARSNSCSVFRQSCNAGGVKMNQLFIPADAGDH